MGYKAVEMIKLRVDNKEVTFEPNAEIPSGIATCIETAIVYDDKIKKEVIFEAGALVGVAGIPQKKTNKKKAAAPKAQKSK